jgi:hypothetical protein
MVAVQVRYETFQWMEQHVFFVFSLIIDGTTGKVLQFVMKLKPIYCQNLCFTEQKNVFLNATEKVQTIKNLLIDTICVMKIFS